MITYNIVDLFDNVPAQLFARQAGYVHHERKSAANYVD